MFVVNVILFSFPANAESNEDPEVVRAKYFIRDEFLVSDNYVVTVLELTRVSLCSQDIL